jgi:hypothetical protein
VHQGSVPCVRASAVTPHRAIASDMENA